MLLSFIIILLSLLAGFISLLLYKKISGVSIFNLNILSVSFWIFFILCFFPGVLILIDEIFSFRIFEVNIYGDFYNRLQGWAIQCWLIISLPIGAIAAKIVIFPNRTVKTLMGSNFSLSKIDIGFGFTPLQIYYVLFLYFILYSLQTFLLLTDTNPLAIALSGGHVVDISVSRAQFSVGTGYLLFDKLFGNDSVILLSLVAYAMSLKTRELKWKLLFLCMAFFNILIGIIGGSTGTVVFYCSVVFFLRYLLVGKLIYYFELIIVLLLIIAVFYFFKSEGDQSFGFLMSHLFSRIFLDQAKGFYYALQIFPDLNPFLGLSSSAIWFHEMIGETTSPDYGYILMYNYSPEAVAIGYGGHFTSMFITEMWANFGWYGVLLGPLWVGFVLFIVHQFFLRKPLTVISSAYYSHIAILGFGYFSDFVRFYYPVNVFLIYFGPILFLTVSALVCRILSQKKEVK